VKAFLSTYQYGSRRQPEEGLRLGVARHVPRGVRREDWRRKNYFDLWLPLVAPTSDLVSQYKQGRMSFSVFSRRYRNQMKAAESRQVIELLATVALFQPISIGCFCEDESHCHRSLLRELILKEARTKASCFSHRHARQPETMRFSSPVCFADDQE